MKRAPAKPATVDDYIASFPPDVRAILERVRATIREAAPEAQETISYQIPCFTHKGPLVYFGGFKKHIGFYPPVQDEKLRRETATYAGEKGNLRFPLDQPIPYALIRKIVKSRVEENQDRDRAKRKK